MNIDAMLAPISESMPCGADISYSDEFHAIAEMRRADDASLAQGEWIATIKVADWKSVESRCESLLSTSTKDFRLAMWLTEAATQNRGYAGLYEGLELCLKLCERYWSDLHPAADGDDMDERIGNMRWLLQRTATMVPALAASHNTAASLGTEARSNEAIDILKSCQATLSAWQKNIDMRLGDDGPSFVEAREALASALHDARRFARASALDGDAGSGSNPALADFFGSARPAGGADSTGLDKTGISAESAAVGNGEPAPKIPGTRGEALQQLRGIATFFRANEPHSPVAYLADKAASWGAMPLHEWLRAVVKEGGALSQLEELLGVDKRT